MMLASLIPPDLEIGSATDPGLKRRGEANQDAILIDPAEGSRPPLFIVADGMGGHAGGALASKLVAEAIADHYCQAGDYRDLPALLGRCLLHAHQVLAEYAARQPEYASMGSTAALAVLLGKQVFIANVGDSRVYLIRGHPSASDAPTLVSQPKRSKPKSKTLGAWLRRIRGGKRSHLDKDKSFTDLSMQQLSYDHSVVADQIRAGKITPLQALRSPKRNRLTQSLTPRRKEIAPFINQTAFAEEDTLLLCSDGLWGVVSEEIIHAVTLELPPQKAAEKLVALALARGAPDNVTVAIARRRGAKAAVAPDDETNP